MLLQQLVEYANVQMALPPPGYQNLPIRYIIDVNPNGTFRGLFDTVSPEAKRGELRLAPHAKRAMGIVPKLMADTAEYVLGIPRLDPKKEPNPIRVAQQHEQFMTLLVECATTTGEPSVQAVRTFLEGATPESLTRPEGFDPSATITFRVDGGLPIDLPSVRSFWASIRAPDEGEDSKGMKAHCLVCGNLRPILERHPLKIKGIPGGQILKDLISANAGAFESYGLNASETSPTCPECAEAYGNALNALLAGRDKTSIWVGDLAYIAWTEPRKPSRFQPISMVTNPQEHEAEIWALMHSPISGREAGTGIDPTRFYSAAFGASGARAVVKDWIDTTVGSAQQSISRYFRLQEMVDWNGERGPFLPLFRLAGSVVRRKETPPDIVYQSLLRLAYAGVPMPLDILYLAVRRNRAEQDVDRGRAILIKMVLDFQPGNPELQESIMPNLDFKRTNPAYVCGRVLATIDRIQRTALGSTNATVIDKFYGSASSAPASVFGNLLDGAQAHMNRLRKEKPGAHTNLDRQLQDILALLDDFPSTLALKDQGLFALGFYHQRAFDRAAATARRTNATGTAASEVESDVPTDAAE